MSRRSRKRRAAVRDVLSQTPKKHRIEDVMAYKGDEALAEFAKDADPEAIRRIERIQEKDDEAKKRWLSKMMTRADTFAALEQYVQLAIVPMANRLDHVETYIEYLEKPLWERIWIRYSVMGVEIMARLIARYRRTMKRLGLMKEAAEEEGES